MKKWMSLLLVCIVFWMWPAYARDLNIVFIPKSRDQDFWVFMRQGVDRALREEGGIRLTWRGPAYNDDIDSQIQILQLYSRPGVDAIIIAATDRVRLAEPARQAVAQGVKLVLVDSGLEGNAATNFVATDNYAAGRLAAERMAVLLNRQGSVALVRSVAGSASTDERANGFLDYLRKHAPLITVVSDEYAGGSRGKATRNAAALLARLPNVDALFAVNETTGDGVLRALRQAGLAGQKKVIAFDSSGFLLDGLRKDQIHGLVVQDPRQMGYLAMKAAAAAARDKPIRKPLILTDAVMVTRDNYQKPEIQALLVP